MSKSKRVFLIISLIFLALVLFFVWDFARRTTFPGQRPAPVSAPAH